MINSLFFLTAVLFLSFRVFPPENEMKNRSILFLLLFLILLPTWYFDLVFIGWALTLAVVDLYLLFYAGTYENFGKWCVGETILFLLCAGAACLLPHTLRFFAFPLLFACISYLWILFLRERISLPLCFFVLLFLAVFGYGSTKESPYLMTACMYLLIYMTEYLYQGFSTAFRTSTANFQTQVMLHHYEEVKSVYLNMSGWRHDYHNHIQTLKAYLSFNQIGQASAYLNELEQDLKQVDSLVKSGNLMKDAPILILDQPTSALDPIAENKLWRICRTL